MQVDTREMGSVHISPQQVFDFVSPILGFETYRRFALIPDPNAPPFYWLQSLDERQLAFVVVSAAEVEVVYQPTPDVHEKLASASAEDLNYWIVVTVPLHGEQLRINPRAPIITNNRTRTAAQVVMRDEYPISCALAASCAD